MKKKISHTAALILLMSFCLTPSLNTPVNFDFETGLVSTGYNDVRIPGNQGTFISFKDDLKPDSDIFYRINLITLLVLPIHYLYYSLH